MNKIRGMIVDARTLYLDVNSDGNVARDKSKPFASNLDLDQLQASYEICQNGSVPSNNDSTKLLK